ncbi:E3 ubiquitin ligase family protein [Flindersiella endophytica]
MLIAGVILLVVGAVIGFFAWRSKEKERKMITTETLTSQALGELAAAAAAAAGPGAFRHTCEVTGTVQPGPGGALKSELSSTECVWHKHVVSRKYWETRRERDSDGDYHTRRVESWERVAERKSDQPFTLVDEQGSVGVHVGGKEPDGVEQVVDRFEPSNEQHGTQLSFGGFSLNLGGGREGTIGYKYEEWVLRPGRRLYVLGEASDASGAIVVTNPSIISTKDEQQLIQEARSSQRWLTIGGSVAAVAGVVLIIVGAVT